jgi:hypothetical protein
LRTLAALLLLAAAGCSVVYDPSKLAPPEGCTAAQKSCAGACVERTDPAFGCGAAECNPCDLGPNVAASCTAGFACIASGCVQGFASCGLQQSCETDIANDAASCGACGHSCQGGTCANGICSTGLLVSQSSPIGGLDVFEGRVYFGSGGAVSSKLATDPLSTSPFQETDAAPGIGTIDDLVLVPGSLPGGPDAYIAGTDLPPGSGHILEATTVGTFAQRSAAPIQGVAPPAHFAVGGATNELWWADQAGSYGCFNCTAPGPFQAGAPIKDVALGVAQVFMTDGRSVFSTPRTTPGSQAPAVSGVNASSIAVRDDGLGRVLVFWTDPTTGSVYRSDLSGTGTPLEIWRAPTPGGFMQVVADASAVYWSDEASGVVMEAALDGSGAFALARGHPGPRELALEHAPAMSDGDLYFVDANPTLPQYSIVRVPR